MVVFYKFFMLTSAERFLTAVAKTFFKYYSAGSSTASGPESGVVVSTSSITYAPQLHEANTMTDAAAAAMTAISFLFILSLLFLYIIET